MPTSGVFRVRNAVGFAVRSVWRYPRQYSTHTGMPAFRLRVCIFRGLLWVDCCDDSGPRAVTREWLHGGCDLISSRLTCSAAKGSLRLAAFSLSGPFAAFNITGRSTDFTVRVTSAADAPAQLRRVDLRAVARRLRRTGARGTLPTGVRLSKSRVISLAWGMLNSNMRSKSSDPATRSSGPMS